MLCDYGCGNIGKFIMSSGKNCCSARYNSCPAIKAKASMGLSKAHADGKMKIPNNFVPWNKGLSFPEMSKADFSLNGKGNHKRVLIYERGYRCECCNNTDWLSKPIALELEHIDGNNKNHIKENLKLLCPNCHAQTSTYRGKNAKRNTLYKVDDSILILALQNSYNIREALLSVNLVGKGGNYSRCKKLLETGIKLKVKEITIDINNSQYGKIWICHLDKKENKKIKQELLPQYLLDGWISGRVTKFGQVAQLVETQ